MKKVLKGAVIGLDKTARIIAACGIIAVNAVLNVVGLLIALLSGKNGHTKNSLKLSN